MLKRFVTAFGASLLFALLVLAPLPVMAQDAPAPEASPATTPTTATPTTAPPTTAPTTTIGGVIRTSDNVAIPGATLRLVETSSGRAWVSWTDENGHFTLPGMAPGHYRVEVAQLGFDPITKEFDVAPQGTAPLELVAKVATLQGIEQQSAQAQQQAAPAQAAAAPASGNSAASANGETPTQSAANGATNPANPNPANPGSTAPGPGANAGRGFGGRQGGRPSGGPGGGQGPGGYRGGQGNPNRGAQGGANPGAPGGAGAPNNTPSGGFQQLALNAPQEQPGEEANADLGAPQGNDAGLGQAATSDAFLMSGTVGRGADLGAAGGGPEGGGGPDLVGPGGPGAGAGVPGFGGQAGGGQAGQAGGPGAGGPGALGGQGGGAPGMNLRVAGPGGGGRGRQGGGARGRPAAPQGVAALWGMQRVMRQRANQVHISLYDQFGDSAFNARPYSLNEANPPKIPSWSERTGGNIGGPLRIPHIYDGSDRTFFYVNVETSWARNPVDQFSTVPTAFERQNLGNFCDRPNVQLYVPPSGNPAGPRTPVGCQIPSSMFDNASLGLLQFVPVANLPGFVNNYHLQTQVPAQTTRLNTRVLQTISPKLNARVIYNFSETATHSFQSFPSFESNVSSRGQSVTLGLTQNLTRTLLNDTQIVYSRNRSQTLNNFANQVNVAGDLGITGISTAPIDFGVPQLSFNNFTGISDAIPALTRNQTYRFVDAVTYTRGKHTLQTGFELRHIENNTFSDPTPEGQFTFNGLITSQLDSTGRPVLGTGLDFADFLLGYPYGTNVRFGTPSKYYRSWGYIGYVTDDWRVKPSFTLETGVRYEAFTPPTELYGHISNLDVNPALSQVSVVVPGETAPYSGALPSSLIRGNYTHFSPRIGIAWRPPLKGFMSKHATTLRAGYGMFYNESIYNQLLSELANQPPWADSQVRTTSSGDILTLENGFPVSSSTTNRIANTYAVNPDYKVGYAQIWNFSTETALTANTSLVLTYTGTKGTNLDLLFAPNRVAPGSISTTGPVANASNFIYDTSGANSIYNALQVRLQRRMTHGIMVNGIYTYGKSMDDASSIGGGTPVVVQNDANLRAEYGLSSFDIRHQVRANYLYEIPLGDHHRFAQKGFSAAAIGNWRLSGNIAWHTGTPFTALVSGTSATNTGSGGAFSTRADQICNPNLPASEQSALHFFNTACFVVPPAGQFGDAARNTIEGPGMFSWNFQISKQFSFGKDQNRRLDVRWEITNLTNTPNLSGLSTLVNSTTFGRVTGAAAMRTMDVMARVNF